MGWLRLVGSFKLQVSFAECSLFYRALLQKRPIIFKEPTNRCHPTPYWIGGLDMKTSSANFTTKSRNWDLSLSRGTHSNWGFGLIWNCTEEFEFLDSVFLGGGALSVDSVIGDQIWGVLKVSNEMQGTFEYGTWPCLTVLEEQWEDEMQGTLEYGRMWEDEPQRFCDQNDWCRRPPLVGTDHFDHRKLDCSAVLTRALVLAWTTAHVNTVKVHWCIGLEDLNEYQIW